LRAIRIVPEIAELGAWDPGSSRAIGRKSDRRSAAEPCAATAWRRSPLLLRQGRRQPTWSFGRNVSAVRSRG